eukprot:c24367_g1_i3 orf=784-1653(-)
MATRNRTALFRKYRDALRQVRLSSTPTTSSSTSSFGVPSSSGPVIELATASFLHQNAGYSMVSSVDADNPRAGAVTVGLPPAWVDISEEIADDMQRARSKMNELIKVHAKALRPTFSDSKVEQRMIEVLTQEITSQIKKCEKNLQRLSVGKGSIEDDNLRKNVQRSLATNLQSLSMEFRKQQNGYLERLRQQQDVPIGADLGIEVKDHSSITINGDDDLSFDRQQMSRVKKVENQTAEREREVLQIVESVNDLAQIMKDLSVLVIDQVFQHEMSLFLFGISRKHIEAAL